MLKKSSKLKQCVIIVIAMTLVLCSCGTSNDLPKGAEYFVPIWFENLSEYTTGNYNRMSDFKNGYATVHFGEMGEYWSMSNESCVIIDKSGEIVLGPLEGEIYLDIIDNKHFYIQEDWEKSKIVDEKNNVIGSFDGILSRSGNSVDEEKINEEGIGYLCSKDYDSESLYKYGLVKKNGEIVVPCEYIQAISEIEDEYIVFKKDETGNIADVYNSDGSFSNTVYSNYEITNYKNGFLELYSNGYGGLTDIYGSIIVEPIYDVVEILSEEYILVFDKELDVCKLLDNKGDTIKDFDVESYSIETTEMHNGVFMFSYYNDTCLVTSKGDVLKKYEGVREQRYCGDGVFSLSFWDDGSDTVRLIDGATGEFIGEKYRNRYDIIFNEGYAVVEDLDYNKFVIDKEGNRYCEGYDILGNVSDGAVRVADGTTAGIICLPPVK